MAKTTEPANETKTRKSKADKKPVDLATATVADGTMQAPRSLYDIIGHRRDPYDTDDLKTYHRKLEAMSLFNLQDHAQKLGVLPSIKRDITIRRLEEAFQLHKSRFPRQGLTSRIAEDNGAELTLQEKAARIMRREM